MFKFYNKIKKDIKDIKNFQRIACSYLFGIDPNTLIFNSGIDSGFVGRQNYKVKDIEDQLNKLRERDGELNRKINRLADIVELLKAERDKAVDNVKSMEASIRTYPWTYTDVSHGNNACIDIQYLPKEKEERLSFFLSMYDFHKVNNTNLWIGLRPESR